MTTSAEAGFTKTVWLFLLHQGGRWKPSELSKEDIGYNGRALSSDLRNLAEAGMLARFDGPTYGVTKNCRIPRGVTLGELSS